MLELHFFNPLVPTKPQNRLGTFKANYKAKILSLTTIQSISHKLKIEFMEKLENSQFQVDFFEKKIDPTLPEN